MIELDRLIEAAAELEPLPPTVTRLAELATSPETPLEEIVRTVGFDPVLTAQVLRWANSGVSASALPVRTVKEAILRVGRGGVLVLALAPLLNTRMAGSAPSFGYDGDDFWKHSVAAAVSVNAIAAHCPQPLPVECFPAALLHDLGKLVLGKFLTPEIARALEAAEREGGVGRLAAEAALLGLHHGDLGALIAKNWKLPDGIVEGIKHHHSPAPKKDIVCDVVYLANIVAKAHGTNVAPETAFPEGHVAVCNRLDLPPSALRAIIAESRGSARTARLMSPKDERAAAGLN